MKTCSKCGEEKSDSDFWKNQRWCKPCDVAGRRERRARNPDKTREEQRRARLLHRYGLTPEQYDAMFAAQDGACAICRTVSEKLLHVDHCHDTDKVRGLLCGPCNRGIGLLRDDPKVVRSALMYLEGDDDILARHTSRRMGGSPQVVSLAWAEDEPEVRTWFLGRRREP